MTTTTHGKIEVLENMLHDVMAELKAQRAEFSSFRDEVRGYIARQEEHNRQTNLLLRGLGTRLGTLEQRVGAVEERMNALEESVSAEA